MKTTKTGITATTLAALALGACNESGFVLEHADGAGNAPVIEGAYGGFLSGAHAGEFYRLLLTDTELWLVYGVDSTTAGFQATGFLQASGTIDGLTYTGTSASEYLGESPNGTGTAAAVYDDAVEPPLLKGSFVIAANTSNFSAGPIAGANFDYTSPALLTALGGSWQVTDLAGNSHALVVDGTNGSFTLDDGDPCVTTGTFTAVEARNSYTGTISFSGSSCPSNVQDKTLNGVALLYANQMPVGTQLIAMFRDVAGNSVGYVLNGVR